MSEASRDDVSAGARDRSYPDHLLRGEPPETQDPAAVERWIDVYGQLLSAKRAILNTLLQRLRRVRQEVREELEDRDLQLLGEEVRRVENRLNFWLDKRRQR
jgi:hypothetical protein